MPSTVKKRRPHHRLGTLLNIMKRERERANRSLTHLKRQNVAHYRVQEFMTSASIDESPNGTPSNDPDGSPDDGLHRQDQ